MTSEGGDDAIEDDDVLVEDVDRLLPGLLLQGRCVLESDAV